LLPWKLVFVNARTALQWSIVIEESHAGLSFGSQSSIDGDFMMIEMLTSIWERLLKLPSVGVEDNFFDLGGTPQLAADLFREIADACGRVLPAVVIYQAPTIKSLAALLGNSEEVYRCPPLLIIKAGTEEPPIFLTPGMGGDVRQFFHIAQYMGLPYPLYGMQPRGSDGMNEPLANIEDMAVFYLQAIMELQPNGPYFFIGYSLGGLIALEIAQLLTRTKQKVGLLAMVDSYPHRRHLSLHQRARLLAQLAVRRVSSLFKAGVRDRDKTTLDATRDMEPFLSVGQRIRASEYLAWKKYRPRFYDGKITFVQARIASHFPDDPAAVWRHLAREFELETVPADHVEILTTHAESLASVLSFHLTKALRTPEQRPEALP
jgi:thioesterase domain-containing protein